MMSRSALSTVALPPRAAERSDLWTAPQAGTETCRLGRRGRREERNIGAPGGAHRRDRSAVDAGRADTGIEPPVIRRVSRQARPIAFCKVERHGHDDTHCRSLGPTPFWGWSPVLTSNSNDLPLRLTVAVRAVLALS